jgi:2-oxoglutarate ferredoxin oxidoreductase subunit gamma
MKRYEIRYAAVGGQGIITAGALLVHIVVEKEDGFALESPTYTAAVRGGPTKVDVIVSNQKIIFPQATAIDFFVCTDQKPFDLYRNGIKEDAVVILDSNLVKDIDETHRWKIHQVPIINETKKRLGNIVLTSVVTLSLTQKLSGIIRYDHMIEYVKEWAPRDFLDLNLKAIELGQGLV